MTKSNANKSSGWFAIVGPGILVAATGVGAGDLATATLTGAELGTAILWAVLVGAGLKYLLNEGLTRWQLVTGTTILEGSMRHLGGAARLLFIVYLWIWSYLVAMALMSACGVTAHAIFPLVGDASQGKIVFGILHSCIAFVLVWKGGFQVFEKIMGVCIGVMFLVVCSTCLLFLPSSAEIFSGLFFPTIPRFSEGGLEWTVALLGGVGGTVTVLCYGYWIREKSRESMEQLQTCRIDLAVGYLMTAVFGLAMVTIGSALGKLDARGATLIIEVATTLESELPVAGSFAKWAFLIGAWGAVFSSLLGVWQSVPYIFTDFWRLYRSVGKSEVDAVESATNAIETNSRCYRGHLLALATVPISGLFLFNFSTAMKINGIVGAIFIPMLTVVLLCLNSREKYLGQWRNRWYSNTLLVVTLAIFGLAGGYKLKSELTNWFWG